MLVLVGFPVRLTLFKFNKLPKYRKLAFQLTVGLAFQGLTLVTVVTTTIGGLYST
jgi:hypothetical protein